MSAELIKSVLEFGTCPQCSSSVITDDEMTSYFCEKDKTHFDLKVVFQGGEKMTATLNGQQVDQTQLEEIDW